MLQLHDLEFVTLETLVIQTVILLIIIWVLNQFLFKPYLKYLDAETEKRKKLEDDYNNIEKLNAEALEQKEEILKGAREEALEIRSGAKVIAKKEAETILNDAGIDANKMRDRALGDIKKERENMMRDIKSRSVDLILKFNEKLFTKADLSKDYIQNEINSIK